ncbi:MAG: hypothetical protein QOF29_484 [bacterium]|jgi:hypothetical protein
MTRPAEGAAAPDLVQAVIGYRQWRLHDGALWSAYVEHRWRRGVNAATCRAEGEHGEPAPGHDCTCGLHAWYRPCPRLASPATSPLVAGAVALWGDIELHPTGMRAQYAMVVVLVRPALPGPKRREVAAMAELLEVDAVPARRLQAAARAHGAPVPAGMVPPARRSPAGEVAAAQLRATDAMSWRPSSLVSGWQPPGRPR